MKEKKHNIDQIINKIKNTGIEIEDISTDEGNLEDVFIDLIKNKISFEKVVLFIIWKI